MQSTPRSPRPGCHTGALLLGALIAGLLCPACSRPRGLNVPAPSKAEALAELRAFFGVQRDAILAGSVRAPQAIGPVIEMAEAMAAHYGPPLTEFVAALKETRTSWGDNPSAQAVKTGLARLDEKLAAVPP